VPTPVDLLDHTKSFLLNHYSYTEPSLDQHSYEHQSAKNNCQVDQRCARERGDERDRYVSELRENPERFARVAATHLAPTA